MSTRQFRNMLICLCAVVLMIGFAAGYWTSASITARRQPQAVPEQQTQDSSASENTGTEAQNYDVPTQEQNTGTPTDVTANAPGSVEITPEPIVPPSSQRYLVKSNMGKLAVYTISPTNEVSLSYVLEVSLDLLPQVDKDKLKEGIEVNSEEELLALIEDYIS